MTDMTPREIVQELDRYIIGQDEQRVDPERGSNQ